MGLFTPNELQAYSKSLSDTRGGSYIAESCIHDITIKSVIMQRNASGARSINICYDYKGNTGVFYGLKLDNNLVDKNTGLHAPNFERAVFFRLCEVCGIKPETLDEVNVTTDTEPYFSYAKQVAASGKEQPASVSVLQDFEDKEVKICVQREWSMYNGSIKKKFVIKDFYRADDNAHASEIADPKLVKGSRYEKDLKFFTGKDRYLDGLTAESVDPAGNMPTTPAASATTANPFK